MNDTNYYLSLVLFILGLCGYGLYFMIMLSKINKNKNPYKFILITGYFILTIHAILNIYRIAIKPKETDVIDKQNVTDFPGNLGYILICIYLCLIINKPVYPQLLIGLFGYFAFVNQINIGAPLLVISFAYSIYHYSVINQLYLFDTIAKIILICYFGLYTYIYTIYTLKHQKQKEIEKSSKYNTNILTNMLTK